jgi:hypothetical protein
MIEISQPQTAEVIFNWHAFGAQGGKIFSSDATVGDIELMTAPTNNTTTTEITTAPTTSSTTAS